MNFEERYEVRKLKATGWTTLSSHDNEGDAEYKMRWLADGEAGTWRVVRVMEVTVASISKAK